MLWNLTYHGTVDRFLLSGTPEHLCKCMEIEKCIDFGPQGSRPPTPSPRELLWQMASHACLLPYRGIRRMLRLSSRSPSRDIEMWVVVFLCVRTEDSLPRRGVVELIPRTKTRPKGKFN